ncbi:MAG: trypsin-like peptidase domain-containing protein, partial [Planctomycetota bacterium]
MRLKTILTITILLGFIPIFLFFGAAFLLCTSVQIWAASEPNTAAIDPNAFVYILNMGISGNSIEYKGLRNGFAIGDGQYILTAAHCVEDFENTNQILRQPMVISPYYGDVFEAEIVAADKENDIAILKPAWDAHPALELETSDEWKINETLTITGYPPPPPSRGGNGTISRQILSEEVPLESASGKSVREVLVGPVSYAGVGWSGSPFISSQTGKVVGIFCRYDTYQYKKYYFFKKKKILHSGPAVESIRQLLDGHLIHHGKCDKSISHLNNRGRFEWILNYLDTLKPDNATQSQKVIKKVCDKMPDSGLLHIIAGWAFDPPQDEQYFQKALETAPNSTLVQSAYGQHLFAYNSPQKAAEQFQIVTERDPNHIFAFHGLLSALVKTDPNAAQILGQQLTQRWGKNAGFHFEYAKAFRAKNKRKDELPMLQKAIELCKEGEVPYVYQSYLAASLMANKQYEESEQAYKKLLETHECESCWWSYTSLLL